MEPVLKLQRFDEIDQDAYCRLQQAAFAEIYAANSIPIERLNRAFLTWKYAPPAGPARIASVWHGDELVASNAMFPLTLARGERRERGWQSCDTATSPAARGKGYFKRCITALRDSIARGEAFFGFPNENSKKGFEGIGWNVNEAIPFRARPVLWGARARREVEAVRAFGADHDELARRLAGDDATMIERSAAYLTWRYLRHPFHAYECFQCVIGGRVEGLLVTNRVAVRGKVLAVVMEFLCADPRATSPLAAAARRSARAAGASVLLAIGNRPVPGLWRVPKALMPKQQLLMGQRVGPPHGPLDERWLVTAGDWDVF